MQITKEQFESLCGFVFDVLEDFPDIATLDGFDIQDIAVTRKVLIPTTVYKPCREEGCNCAEFYSDDAFKAGATCYKRVDWLTRVAEQRDGADLAQHSGLDQKQEFENCPNCGLARIVDGGVMAKCPFCGDDETELLLDVDVP